MIGFTNIFGNEELVRKWMRNQISSFEINKLIVQNTGIEGEKLDKLFNRSIFEFKLEEEIKRLAESVKHAGKKIGIVTDNMDVFTQILISNLALDNYFDVIINSADYGMLKKDDYGKLFDIALDALEEKIENSLIIDDSITTINLYRQKGGHGCVYKDFAELKLFLGNMELI